MITARFSREKEPRLRERYLSLADDTMEEDCGYEKSTDANYIFIKIPFVGCGTTKDKVCVSYQLSFIFGGLQ